MLDIELERSVRLRGEVLLYRHQRVDGLGVAGLEILDPDQWVKLVKRDGRVLGYKRGDHILDADDVLRLVEHPDLTQEFDDYVRTRQVHCGALGCPNAEAP